MKHCLFACSLKYCTLKFLGSVCLFFKEAYLFLKKIQTSLYIVVRLLSCVQLFATLWTIECQAPLSSTISQSLFKLISIELVTVSNHLILCHPLLLFAFNISQHQDLFQWIGSFHQVAKVLELQLHQSFQLILYRNLFVGNLYYP